MSNGDKLHQEGFKGQGMTIAVIDAGFHNGVFFPSSHIITAIAIATIVPIIMKATLYKIVFLVIIQASLVLNKKMCIRDRLSPP